MQDWFTSVPNKEARVYLFIIHSLVHSSSEPVFHEAHVLIKLMYGNKKQTRSKMGAHCHLEVRVSRGCRPVLIRV